jgi:hypothetical protein
MSISFVALEVSLLLFQYENYAQMELLDICVLDCWTTHKQAFQPCGVQGFDDLIGALRRPPSRKVKST